MGKRMAETNRTNSKVLIKSNSGLPLSFLPRQEANRAGSSWTTRGVMGLKSLGVLASHSQHGQQQMQKSQGRHHSGSSLMKHSSI